MSEISEIRKLAEICKEVGNLVSLSISADSIIALSQECDELLEALEEIVDNQTRFGEVPSFVWDKAFDAIRKSRGEE